jgi:hypothetical protein
LLIHPHTPSRALAVLSLVVAPLFAAGPAGAQTLCTEPIVPACVDFDLTYDNEGSIQRCEEDLKKFDDQLDEYVACLDRRVDELETLRGETRERFTCRSEGRENCP